MTTLDRADRPTYRRHLAYHLRPQAIQAMSIKLSIKTHQHGRQREGQGNLEWHTGSHFTDPFPRTVYRPTYRTTLSHSLETHLHAHIFPRFTDPKFLGPFLDTLLERFVRLQLRMYVGMR